MTDVIPAVLLVIGVTAAAAENAGMTNSRRWHPLATMAFTLTLSATLWGLIFWVVFKFVGLI